jgi:hypothetical protein
MGAKKKDDGFVIMCTYAKEKLQSGCRTLVKWLKMDWIGKQLI